MNFVIYRIKYPVPASVNCKHFLENWMLDFLILLGCKSVGVGALFAKRASEVDKSNIAMVY